MHNVWFTVDEEYAEAASFLNLLAYVGESSREDFAFVCSNFKLTWLMIILSTKLFLIVHWFWKGMYSIIHSYISNEWTTLLDVLCYTIVIDSGFTTHDLRAQ